MIDFSPSTLIMELVERSPGHHSCVVETEFDFEEIEAAFDMIVSEISELRIDMFQAVASIGNNDVLFKYKQADFRYNDQSRILYDFEIGVSFPSINSAPNKRSLALCEKIHSKVVEVLGILMDT